MKKRNVEKCIELYCLCIVNVSFVGVETLC